MFCKKKVFLSNNKESFKNSMMSSINISLTLIALNVLSSNFFISESILPLFVTVFILLGLTIFNIPFKEIIKKNMEKNESDLYKLSIFGLVLIIFSFVIFIFTRYKMLWFISITILISGIDILLEVVNIKRKELQLLAVSSFVYTIFFMFLQTTPILWNALKELSLLFTSTIGHIISKPLSMGPSTSGLWIVIIFFVFLSTAFFLTGLQKKKYFFISVSGLIICWAFYLVLIGSINVESNNQVMDYIFILFILCLIPSFFYLSRVRINYYKIQIPNVKKLKISLILKNKMTLIVVFLLISIIFSTTFVDSNKKDDEDINILFYGQKMLGGWTVPNYAEYGKESPGMFGLLPCYLDILGYKSIIITDNKTEFIKRNVKDTIGFVQYANNSETVVNNQINSPETNTSIVHLLNITDYTNIIESKKITKEILEDIDIFVVINLNESFNNDENEIIWDFVKEGGSLLVLGDHTNIGNIQEPLNKLLKPIKTEYRFDSGFPISEWINCYQIMHHPITSNLEMYSDDIAISIGASLNISFVSTPIIIGRYAFSDRGNISNIDKAYLGDYKYNSGEQIGDIILASGSYYGDGKILVFGDTSSYQNIALPLSIPFVKNVFKWLSSSRTESIENIQIIVSIILLFSAIFLYNRFKKQKTNFVLLSIVVCIALLLSSSVNSEILGEDKFKSDSNIIYIDSYHNERFYKEPFNDQSLSGTIINLMRNSYLPIIINNFEEGKIKNSKAIILNAPTKKLKDEEVEFIKEYIKKGGVVLLATGYDDKEASMPLLREFGLDILDIPLGSVPYVEEDPESHRTKPRFVDSWPIKIEGKNDFKTEIFYSINISENEYILMTFTSYNNKIKSEYQDYSGGLLLIGDSQFLIDKNIESLEKYWPGNIQFLKNIIDELKDKGALK